MDNAPKQEHSEVYERALKNRQLGDANLAQYGGMPRQNEQPYTLPAFESEPIQEA